MNPMQKMKLQELKNKTPTELLEFADGSFTLA